MAKLIYELLPELRAAHDPPVTVPELARMTTRNQQDVPQKSIEALESRARAGQIPKRHTLEALAAALGIEPNVFYEWPIAVAQATRSSSREDARTREEEALRTRAQRTNGRREGARDATPVPLRQTDQAP